MLNYIPKIDQSEIIELVERAAQIRANFLPMLLSLHHSPWHTEQILCYSIIHWLGYKIQVDLCFVNVSKLVHDNRNLMDY